MEKVTKKVFIQTWGWPYVTVACDGLANFEEGVWV